MSWDIKANITGDDKDLRSKLKDAEGAVRRTSDQMAGHFTQALGGNFFNNLFSKSLQAVGLGAVAELTNKFASSFKEKFRNIKNEVARTSLGAETVQKLNNLEDATDVPSGSFQTALEHTAQAQQKVLAGGEEGLKAMRAFALLGVSVADAHRKSYQELGLQIFEYIKKIDLAGEHIAALKEIYGKTGTILIPAAKKGLDSTVANSGVYTDEDLANARAMKKELEGIEAQWAEIRKKAELAANSMSGAAKSAPFFGRKIVEEFIWPTFYPERYQAMQEAKAHAGTEKAFAAEEQKRKEQEESKKRLAEADAEYERVNREHAEELRQKKIQEHLPQLEEKYSQAERKARMERMTPEQRKAALKNELDSEIYLRDQNLGETSSLSEAEQNQLRLQHGIKALEIQEELKRLSNGNSGHGGSETLDRLARIGGGFVAADHQADGRRLEAIHDTLQSLLSEVQTNHRMEDPDDGF